MKRLYRPLTYLLTALTLTSFNSCYFNSAGHIFDKAGHRAAVCASDIRPGQTIYLTQNGYHYIELPRYRADKPIITQYPSDSQKQGEAITAIPGETVLVRIPQDYAMYLIGMSEYPTTPSFLKPTSLSEDEVKHGSTRLTITRDPAESIHRYEYTSPNAFWWCTLGLLDWLCIDLPITCAENAIYLSGSFVLFLDELEHGNTDMYYNKSNVHSAIAQRKWKAVQGDEQAMYELANIYRNKKFATYNANLSVFYCKLAAEAGHAQAQADLAQLYASGEMGVRKNGERAFYWAQKSAKQDNSDGMLMMGVCYSEGIGVKQDPAAGAMWIWLAAGKGHPEAKAIIDRSN